MYDYKTDQHFFNQLIQSNFILEEFQSNPQQQDAWIRYNGHLVKLTCFLGGGYKMHGPNETDFAKTYFPNISWHSSTYMVMIESEGFCYRLGAVDFWNEDTGEKFINYLKDILENEFKF